MLIALGLASFLMAPLVTMFAFHHTKDMAIAADLAGRLRWKSVRAAYDPKPEYLSDLIRSCDALVKSYKSYKSVIDECENLVQATEKTAGDASDVLDIANKIIDSITELNRERVESVKTLTFTIWFFPFPLIMAAWHVARSLTSLNSQLDELRLQSRLDGANLNAVTTVMVQAQETIFAYLGNEVGTDRLEWARISLQNAAADVYRTPVEAHISGNKPFDLLACLALLMPHTASKISH